MTSDQAEWVRTNAWPKTMQRADLDLVNRCACQQGMSPDCEAGAHGKCKRGEPLSKVETYIKRDGVCHFPKVYEHPVSTALGRVHTNAAQVWLADRMCRRICPCDCHSALAPAVFEPVGLFDLAEVTV